MLAALQKILQACIQSPRSKSSEDSFPGQFLSPGFDYAFVNASVPTKELYSSSLQASTSKSDQQAQWNSNEVLLRSYFL